MLKTLLIIYNVVFGIIGAGLLVAGIIMYSQLDVAMEYLGEVAAFLVIMLIGIGLVIIVLSLLGCLGAGLESGWILIVVAILLFLVAIAKLFAGITALSVDDSYLIQGDKMDDAVKKYRISSDARENMDMIQQTFFCCGSNNYDDYIKPDNLPATCCKKSVGDSVKGSTGNSDKGSLGNSDQGSTGNSDMGSIGNSDKGSTGDSVKDSVGNIVKESLGNTGKKKPGASVLKTNSVLQYMDGCRRSGKEEDHYLIGCKEALLNVIRKIKLCIGGVILGFIVVEVVGVICSVGMVINISKQPGHAPASE